MILLLRALPTVTAILTAFSFWLQSRLIHAYPWIALIGVFAVPLASIAISKKHLKLPELVEKMLPTFICVAALAFGLLLVEGKLATWATITLSALVTYISLELLFLLAHHRAAYPVNALSRVNLAYVPLATWYAVSTSAGVRIFLHTPRFLHLALTTLLGTLLFKTTAHPGASRAEQGVWTVIGAIAGLEIGWIGMQLPVTIGVQGAIAALLFTGALRARRYLYHPKPTVRVAWGEVIGWCALSLVTLGSAKWL